ncbi:MAG: hypothetical protein FWD38_11580 [Oscillospiraceae bacterium]|nr:hypothetical protein [Oscillospiraceae bacterium]
MVRVLQDISFVLVLLSALSFIIGIILRDKVRERFGISKMGMSNYGIFCRVFAVFSIISMVIVYRVL